MPSFARPAPQAPNRVNPLIAVANALMAPAIGREAVTVEDVVSEDTFLVRGSRGPAVADLQHRLTHLGYGVQATGELGPTTEGLIRRFQEDHRVGATGKVGPQTLLELRVAEASTGARPLATAFPSLERGGTLQVGSAGLEVRTLQRLLAVVGFPTTVDGKFGPQTAEALRGFQRAARVSPTGAFGATTMGALGERLQSRGLTTSDIVSVMGPSSTATGQANAQAWTRYMNTALQEFDVTTPQRQGHFLAQVLHETDGFRTLVEYDNGWRYSGRADLGNRPGTDDGPRYRGRGAIQLTGRDNYAAASLALGVDYLARPELAASPEHAFRIAGWFWSSRDINRLADRDDLEGVTRAVNGGLNGYAQRREYLQRARHVFRF